MIRKIKASCAITPHRAPKDFANAKVVKNAEIALLLIYVSVNLAGADVVGTLSVLRFMKRENRLPR